MNPETTISADPDVPLVRIERQFNAPPNKVFRAHVDPALVVQWLGPRDLTMEIDTWDCRSGGAYRYLHHHEGQTYAFHGCFHHVLPEQGVIVQTFTFEGFPDGVSLERLTLTALPGGRTQLVATSLVDSFEARDAMLASGMEVGINQGYERLDELFAAEKVA
ncbi:MAG: SRPBCC family protein [Alphaproteobacteria bacterium]|nr:SRPBCC family protein [Alphaproteobacteria bacterium]MCB9796802.1 SRPBCC family protein [Alphaproteobacteria bacterium]